MSKSMADITLKHLNSMFTAKKTEGGEISVSIADTFKNKAVKAADDLDAVFIDVKPVAINLWGLYRLFCAPEGEGITPLSVEEKKIPGAGSMNRLSFFRMFDQTIPSEWGKVGSDARKKVESHSRLNRLTYLTLKVGKAAVIPPKKRDPKVAAKVLKGQIADFGNWAKKFKVSRPALEVLVTKILKLVKKDDKSLTKKGKDYLKAAGLSIAE